MQKIHQIFSGDRKIYSDFCKRERERDKEDDLLYKKKILVTVLKVNEDSV